MDRHTIRPYTLETLCIHAGQAPDRMTGSRAAPIYQTTSYVFADTAHAQQLFNLDEAGNIYSRIGNPTVDVLEKRVAQMEGGVAAVAFSSGQAAMTSAILALAGAGDEIVASTYLYGGTYTLFSATLPQMGISVKFVDPRDPENFRSAITQRTKCIVAETIGNPTLHVLDIEAVANIAHDAGIPLIVDSTFATPALCRPIAWGADIVVHSATKWLGGHGTSIGGIVVDGGRFDYGSGRFPQYVDPDPTYHGIRFWNEFGTLAYSVRLRARYLRDVGACMSPFNAFLILLGVETLCLRMERHCQNAARVASHLTSHPAVAWVNYPGLSDHPSHETAKKYLDGGFGAMVVFGIHGGLKAGANLIDRCALWSHLANVGDAKSLIIHPASTTHQQLRPPDREKAGVTDDLVRLSVGLEGVSDLIAELDDALAEATGIGERGEAIVNSESVIRRVAGAATVPIAPGMTERRAQAIAVVGLSPDPGRPSHRVSRKLQRQGYRIIPVHPAGGEILGEPVKESLAAVDGPVDVVLVFRASKYVPEIAEEAVRLGIAPVLWMQEGIESDEGAAVAAAGGMDVVMNRCMWKEVQRLQGSINTYLGAQ